ncbi:MAG: histidine phosphatase family protein, partial [Clostridia bacterium]|nr:histidine phosphatase family protein [Clostridia bacterium]
MKIYLTRHGQVVPVKFTGTVDCPDRDIALSDLGEKQAKLLGKELALRNF